jgi:hypothetical protein
MKAFGLRFAAFDFVVRPDHRWVFLELTDRWFSCS